MYEATDALTKYLPHEYAGVIKYVEVNGRTKIAIKNVISEYIPNPTFNEVAARAPRRYFKDSNPDAKTQADQGARRCRSTPPAFFEPRARIMLMDELGIDRAMMWPTLASLLEERLTDDPDATSACPRAQPVDARAVDVQLRGPDLRHAGDHAADRRPGDRGARVGGRAGRKAILMRPAPVPDFEGPRSFALPEFDPFWEKVVEADIVGRHARLRQRLPALRQRVGGPTGEFLPFNPSLATCFHRQHRATA